MSDASDPRHANPDPAKRHQAAEVATAAPGAAAASAQAPAATQTFWRPSPGLPGRAIATMTTTRRVLVDVEIEASVWADDDSAQMAAMIEEALRRARRWLNEAIGRLPKPVGGAVGNDGAYSVRSMAVAAAEAPARADGAGGAAADADAAPPAAPPPAVKAALRDAADALVAEARNKRGTIHADVFGDGLPARYEEIAARCRAFVADAPPAPIADAPPAPIADAPPAPIADAPPAPIADAPPAPIADGPPAPPAIEDAPRRHDLRWSWDWRSELWFAHEPGRATSTVHRPPAGMLPMWAPNEGRWFWFDDGGYQKRRQSLLQEPGPMWHGRVVAQARTILQAGSTEGLTEAAARQMAELEANRKLRLAAEERALRAEERAATASRDVDIWKRDANALRERLASADDALGKAGLELANRRRDWHEERTRMLEILAGLVPDVAKRADVESLTDIAHIVVGELGAQAVAAARWRNFDVLFHSIGAWSLKTFGPGPRAEAILDHVAKEARECLAKPADAEEWIDLAMLAMDGARRCAGLVDTADWIEALEAKHRKNQARTWPDWRTQDPRKAIEHDRAGEPAPASADDEALADCRLELTRLRDACLHDARRITDVIDVLIARAMREGQP